MPIPKFEVVLNIVDMFGEVPPEEKSGFVAVTAVIEPPEVPQAPAIVVRTPPTPAWTQLPAVRVDTERFALMVEDPETSMPFADPFTKFGKIKVSVRFVILHGMVVTACAVKGTNANAIRKYLSQRI